MYHTKAYSAASETSPLVPTTIPRRDPTERDVQFEILFCGICHSDLDEVRNEWKNLLPAVYPMVPGHEIVGRVTKVGSAVTKYLSHQVLPSPATENGWPFGQPALKSGKVEAVEIHHLSPRRYKVLYELLQRVLTSVHFGYSPEF